MKDSKQIRKVLFVGKSNIALVVSEIVDNENNILFANEVKTNLDNLQVKISELLTNAANFLGFNIKSVEMIFDDNQIETIELINQVFADCTNEDDIKKEIFKLAKINNKFVSEINFLGIVYNEFEKTAKLNANVCVSDYITYKKYLKAITACNVVVTNSNNIYKLIKANKDQIELSIQINDNVAVACQFYGSKLNKVDTITLDLNQIYQHISEGFGISVSKVENALAVAKELASSQELDVAVSNNYDLRTKSFSNIKVIDLLTLYRDEVKTQINKHVDYRNFHSVRVVSDNVINQIDGFGFVINDDMCFDNISVSKLVCLANINNDEITQFIFENRLKSVNLLA